MDTEISKSSSENQLMLSSVVLSIFKHYVLISTIIAMVFSVTCMYFGVAYLREFDINFFLFVGLSDIYQIPLSKGVILQLLFLIISLISTLILIISFIVYFIRSNKYIGVKPYKKNLVAVLIWIGLLVFTIGGFTRAFSIPGVNADELKNGFSSRYNINMKNKNYQCVSIIGSSSNYVFAWDYVKNNSIIVTKSFIKDFNQVVPSNPPLSLKTIYKISLVKAQNEWSKLLNNTCSQNVRWPGRKINGKNNK